MHQKFLYDKSREYISMMDTQCQGAVWTRPAPQQCVQIMSYYTAMQTSLNTLRQNGRRFPDIFKCIFLNENMLILIRWSLFPWVQLTADQATSHYLNQWWLYYRRIYASLGLNESKHITWRNHMETFSASLALYEANPPVTSGFRSQRQWRWAETNDW